MGGEPCVNCNGAPGSPRNVELTTDEGEDREYEMSLCDGCAGALDGQEWLTVERPSARPTDDAG